MKKLLILLAVLYSTASYAQDFSGKSWLVTETPTVAVATYTAGDSVGGLLTLENALKDGVFSGRIAGATISDEDGNADAMYVVIFKANPTTSTFTNEAAPSISDADLPKIACILSVDPNQGVANFSAQDPTALPCSIATASSTTLYAALITAGTPTYTATDALVLNVAILQD